MKPFFQNNQTTVFCGDVLEVLPHIESESVDMVFADPPFNVGKNYGKTKDNRDDYEQWCADWISECFRTLKPSGTFYLMTIPRHLPMLYPMMSERGVFINQVNWKNVSAAHAKKGYWNSYQPILTYAKTPDFHFEIDAEVQDSGLRRWGGYSAGSSWKGRMKDTWDDIPLVYAGSIRHPEAIIKKGTNSKAHPCQMPTALVKRAAKFSCPVGGTILDPFLGSGTTIEAAQQVGCKSIGIEINEDYCQISIERLAQRSLIYSEAI